MSKEYKREYIVPSLKSMESHFEAMAKKGWMIDSVKYFSLVYRKTEPKDLIFYVDEFPRITVFDYPNSNDAKEYRLTCEMSGWKFATNAKSTQVFFTEANNPNTIPIHTDVESTISAFTHGFKRELFSILFLLAVLAYSGYFAYPFHYSALLSNSGILQWGFLVLCIPLGIIRLIQLLWHQFRNVGYAKKSQQIPRENYIASKLYVFCLMFASIATIIFTIAVVLIEIKNGIPAMVFSILLPFPIVFAISVGFAIRVQTVPKSNSRNKVGFFILLIAAPLISMLFAILMMPHIGGSAGTTNPLPEDRPAIHLSNDTIERSHYKNNASVFFPFQYEYYESSKSESIETKVIVAKTSGQAKLLFDSFIKQNSFENEKSLKRAKRSNNEALYAYELEHMRPTTEMTPEQVAAWGAQEGAYLSYYSDTVLLRYDTVILQIQTGYLTRSDLMEYLQKEAAALAIKLSK